MSKIETKELKDSELKNIAGGLNVFSDESTITMIFSTSDNPSNMMISIKNHVTKQIGCYFDIKISDNLQNILNEMSSTGKTYLKINYIRDGEFITDISVNTIF